MYKKNFKKKEKSITTQRVPQMMKISELNDFFDSLPVLDQQDIEDFNALLVKVRQLKEDKLSNKAS